VWGRKIRLAWGFVFPAAESEIMNSLINLKTFLEIVQANTILIVLVALIFFLILTIWLLAKYLHSLLRKIDALSKDLRLEIQDSVRPKFMEISLGVNELVDLAIEVWRVEQRISKSAPNLPENQLKGLENSVQKLRRYLERYDVEIVDYKNQKFNEGLNLDILSIEKDPSLPQPMVKETVEPTIMCKGQVVRKAKIILLTNK
jgi:hypothetical protein